jgi:hypothetical protein
MPTINQRDYYKVDPVKDWQSYGASYRYWFMSYTGKTIFARNLKDLTRRIGQDVIDQQKAGDLAQDMAGEGFINKKHNNVEV